MLRITVKLDDASLRQLEKLAEAERRPLAWQAEVLLKRALEQFASTSEVQHAN